MKYAMSLLNVIEKKIQVFNLTAERFHKCLILEIKTYILMSCIYFLILRKCWLYYEGIQKETY